MSAETVSQSADDRSNHGTTDTAELLRSIPAIHELVTEARRRNIDGIAETLPREVVTGVVRKVSGELRAELLAGKNKPPGETLAARIDADLRRAGTPPLSALINATGIILHTGLGRAPLAKIAVDRLAEVAAGYAPVELEMTHGTRGKRSAIVRDLLCQLTGAESATVVNNNAAALLLVFTTLAPGKEVIVSRGELVEIGGSFRLPEVLAASGAILREVGTTNKTRQADYATAINDNTAAILKIHPSNYRLEGFTATTQIAELATLGRAAGIPVIQDTGSGLLRPATEYGLTLETEPNARASIAAGADLVLFSGDKLLGGPQAGIIVGRRELVEKIEKQPLLRALRVDKLTLAALGTTLQLHFDPRRAATEIPTLRMATEKIEIVRARAERLRKHLADKLSVEISIAETTAYLGGGSVPGQEIASLAVVLRPLAGAQFSARELAARLRRGEPPVVARVNREAVWLDLRTVGDDAVELLGAALTKAACKK